MSQVNTIYLIHHSHTDVGYTHDQPILWDLQTRFLDEALEIADRYADKEGDAAFRWTVETTKALEVWLQRASDKQIERFRQLERAGRIEVTAMFGNITPLYDTGQLVESFRLVGELRRDYGFTIRSAMNCDVNGENWPLVDILLDLGIDGFSMAINEHFGGAPLERPNAFKWEGPSGRHLLAWNGWPYNTGWRYGIGRSADDLKNVWWPRTKEHLDRIGYPLPVLMIQTYHPFGDNGSAYAPFVDFIETWNKEGNTPRIRLATPSEWWQVVKEHADNLPVHRGDWTDYWNFGCISSAREQAINRQNRVRLRAADALAAALKGLPEEISRRTTISMLRYRTQAWDALNLFDEHTWGADCSILSPGAEDTASQWAHKANYAYTARSLSLMLQRDAVADFASAVERTSADDLLVFNPLPWTRKISGVVSPALVRPRGVPEDETSGRHYQDRSFHETLTDVLSGTVPWWRWGDVKYLKPVEVPGMGYRVMPKSQVTDVFADATVTEQAVVETDQWRITFDLERGGIASWYDKKNAREWIDQSYPYPLNGFVHEKVADERGWARARVSEAHHFNAESVAPPRGWKPHWRAIRQGSRRLVEHTVFKTEIGYWVYQRLEAPGISGLLNQLVYIPNNEGYIECESWWDMTLETHPEATYLVFPFDIPCAVARFDVGGQAVIAGEEQLPGSCRDYFTTQQWIDFSNGEFGVTVATPINPMVQFGDFHFGHNQKRFVLERATLLGWVTNNYWETNFRAHQPGRVNARYRIFPYVGPFDEARAHRFGLEAAANSPLLQHLGERPDQERLLPDTASLLNLPEPPVLVVSMKPATQDKSMIIRLQNASDAETQAQIGSKALKIVNAREVDLVDEHVVKRDVTVNEGTLVTTMLPREIKTLLITFS